MKKSIFVVTLFCMMFTSLATADALPVDPGLWKFTSTGTNPMTGQQESETDTECVVEDTYDPAQDMDDEGMDSDVADIVNSSSEGYGGAITAALYLNDFVDEKIEWAHFDVNAWNTRNRPGRPKGGEAMGLLAVFEYLQQRYQ